MSPLRFPLLLALLASFAGAAPSGVLTQSQRHAAAAFSRSASPGDVPGARIVSLPGRTTTDGVEIVRTAASPAHAGAAGTVTVRLRYSLISQSKAMLYVGLNTTPSGRFQMQRRQWIQAGQGEIELNLETPPGTGSADRPLRVCALLSPDIYAAMGSSLAAHATNVSRPASSLFAAFRR